MGVRGKRGDKREGEGREEGMNESRNTNWLLKPLLHLLLWSSSKKGKYLSSI